MKSERVTALTRKVTEAVLAVPGIACLRPGLRSLLYAADTPPPAAHHPGDPGPAVRSSFDFRGGPDCTVP
ncbi:hypothetical protein [Streptomyces roseus]|uniref:Uncharacterized protein n=1 Tax=Streptomyces roseus TaxID=66430 RepID=A0A0J6XF01_9ACTN|nr:hypothetical protein [Streptomyces roseus]KMO94515.1 hypothetical protein ACS04_28250 [Streptomyces roseus]